MQKNIKVLEIDYEFFNNSEDEDKKYYGVKSPDKILLFYDKDHKIFSTFKRVT